MKNSTRRTKSAETDGSGLHRAIARAHSTDRHHRPRLCRLAAGLPVRGEGLSDHRLRHRYAEGDGAQRRAQLHQAHPGQAHRRRCARAAGSTRPTTSRGSKQMDAIIICVPTPLTKYREPDLQFVVKTGAGDRAAPAQGAARRAGIDAPIPAPRDEDLKPILEATGLKAGVDFFLAFSPEREDPGNAEFRHRRHSEGRRRRRPGRARRSPSRSTTSWSCKTVPVSLAGDAEAVKLTENIFRAVNIALVNELKVVYAAMGIDVWEVIEAAKTKPFGFMPFYPGPGPRRALHPDRSVLPHLEGARVRHHHPLHRAGRRDQHRDAALCRRHAWPRRSTSSQAKALKGARILLLGLAYKKNVDDMRESPALILIELLEKARRQGLLPRSLHRRGEAEPRARQPDRPQVGSAHS